MNIKEVNFKRIMRLRVEPAVTVLFGKTALVVAFCFLLSAYSFAQNPGGTTGALIWEFNVSDSTLTITGNDTMPDYLHPLFVPWFGYNVSFAVIENGVKSIGMNAFCGLPLKDVKIGNTVTTIRLGAFLGCLYLTSVTIPNTVTIIEKSAFAITGLTSVTIPNSVIMIEGAAFANCNSLRFLSIGNSVATIGGGAFGSSTNIDTIICNANIPPTIEESYPAFANLSAIVYVPCSSIAAYQTAHAWKDFTNYQAIGGIPLPAVPDNVSVSQKDNALDISWESTGTASYEVYRNNALLATTTSTAYRDSNLTNNVNYCYKINARGDSCVSGLSTETCKVFTSDVGTSNYELPITNYVKIYPNPTGGKITIRNEQCTIKNVEIYSIVGQSVFTTPDIEKSEIIIDISHLQTGIYFLKIDGKTMKLVKK